MFTTLITGGYEEEIEILDKLVKTSLKWLDGDALLDKGADCGCMKVYCLSLLEKGDPYNTLSIVASPRVGLFRHDPREFDSCTLLNGSTFIDRVLEVSSSSYLRIPLDNEGTLLTYLLNVRGDVCPGSLVIGERLNTNEDPNGCPKDKDCDDCIQYFIDKYTVKEFV